MKPRLRSLAGAGIDTTVPAVALKLQSDHYAHGRLAVVRSLGRLGVPVHSTHERAWDPVRFSRYATGRLVAPFPRFGAAELVRYLVDLAARIGDLPVLIATDDVAALFVEDQAGTLSDHYRFPAQPPGLARQLADKGALFHLCHHHDVATPEVVFPRDLEHVERFAEGASFPVVVKSMDPQLLRARRGAKSVVIVSSPEELLRTYRTEENAERPNLMFQEHIPGGPENNWMFNGYFDTRSNCVVGFTGRKLRQDPPGVGPTSLGICEANEHVRDVTVRFMKAIGYRGIVDMGYRYDRRDRRYKLLDVNPRVGSTFRLFVGTGDLDVVRALYLDLTGQPVPSTRSQTGRKWLMENGDLRTFLAERRHGRLSGRQWARSLAGVQETAWFAADDPIPFLAMTALFSLVGASRTVTRELGLSSKETC